MALSRSWRVWILMPLGLLVVAIVGIWLLFSFMVRPLHPDSQAIPSVTQVEAPPQWSVAVQSARLVVRSGLAEQNLPGLSVAVGAGGNIVWSEGFGWAELETQAPLTPDTRFRIGSASTLLSSAAAGLLLEQGSLKLDDPIQTYLPQFPRKQWPLTLRELMAHTAGLGTDGGGDGPLYRQRCEQLADALPSFANDALLYQPGTQYRHSNYGWILVSAAVESAAGQPFHAFMRRQIFQPLGMRNTGAESATEENPERVGEEEEDPPIATFARQVILKPLGIIGTNAIPATAPATSYLPGFGPNPLVRYGLHVLPQRNLSCYAGSMAFLSTPSDLVRFGLAINSGKLLQPATVQLLQTSQQLASGEETGHGLGWDMDTLFLGGNSAFAGEATKVLGRDGEVQGHRMMSFLIIPESGIVVALMTNATYADTPALARKVAEAFASPASQ